MFYSVLSFDSPLSADSTRQYNFTQGMMRKATMPKCFSPFKEKYARKAMQISRLSHSCTMWPLLIVKGRRIGAVTGEVEENIDHEEQLRHILETPRIQFCADSNTLPKIDAKITSLGNYSSDHTLGSSFKCNTQSPLGIGCCDGHTKQAPQQRGPWRDISRA
jgi:hypothetical protein